MSTTLSILGNRAPTDGTGGDGRGTCGRLERRLYARRRRRSLGRGPGSGGRAPAPAAASSAAWPRDRGRQGPRFDVYAAEVPVLDVWGREG